MLPGFVMPLGCAPCFPFRNRAGYLSKFAARDSLDSAIARPNSTAGEMFRVRTEKLDAADHAIASGQCHGDAHQRRHGGQRTCNRTEWGQQQPCRIEHPGAGPPIVSLKGFDRFAGDEAFELPSQSGDEQRRVELAEDDDAGAACAVKREVTAESEG